jgi:hypothetical protein
MSGTGPPSAMSGTASSPSLIGRPQTMQVFVVSVSVMPSSTSRTVYVGDAMPRTYLIFGDIEGNARAVTVLPF